MSMHNHQYTPEQPATGVTQSVCALDINSCVTANLNCHTPPYSPIYGLDVNIVFHSCQGTLPFAINSLSLTILMP